MKYPKAYHQVITDIKSKARRHGVKIEFAESPEVYLDEDQNLENGCGGFFYPKKLILKVATGNRIFDQWFPIFLHESCHMDQFLDKNLDKSLWKIWMKSVNDFSWWLSGRDFTKNEIDDIISHIMQFERDCDMRAIEKIKHYNIPISIKRYIKSSNLYLFSYLIMKEKRKWLPQLSTSRIDLAPSTFDNDYTVVPPRLRQHYEKCIEKYEAKL